MSKIKDFFIFLLYLKFILSSPYCKEGENHCSMCNPISKLCYKCDKDIYIPDENGGCKNAHKCVLDENYCLECNEQGNSCKNCIIGYFPDENGGCSYTDNCEISEGGHCIKCKEGFILVGRESYLNEGIRLCKSLYFGDLKNCEEVNTLSGICERCKEGYYLTKKDNKCTNTENCYESTFGTCKKCINKYYLNKKDEKCYPQEQNFEHCKITIDGKKCDSCDDNYFFDDDGKCTEINFCSKSLNNGICEECKSGYYLTRFRNACVSTENCEYGNKEIGVCSNCNEGYYIDYKDGKCKPNQEDNDFKYCRIADDLCNTCINGYYISKDHKCSKTKNCAEANNGSCFECMDGYYLGLDKLCTNVEHCIYSNGYTCTECEDGYFYWGNETMCEIADGNLTNCLFSFGGVYCQKCKYDYYINLTDTLCYPNNLTDRDPYYKCFMTSRNYDRCLSCADGYYLGSKDYLCCKIDGCAISQSEDRCLECNENYCLDMKTGKCMDNDFIEDEDKKFYYRCNKTNEDGTACGECINGYTLNEDGLCFDEDHCEEKNNDGKCIKCKKDNIYTYCLNSYFGCEKTFRNDHCLECDDILDFNNCTKCIDGYTNNDYGKCIEIN